MLKQYHIKIDIFNLTDWNVVNVVSPGEAGRAAAITLAFSFR